MIVMSATLDTDLLETHLRPCHVLNSQGSMFPVESEYLKRETVDEPPWEVAADSFAQARTTGDVLIFNARRLRNRAHNSGNQRSDFKGVVLPLHDDLSPRLQDAAVATHPERKIVVSTNVAENLVQKARAIWVRQLTRIRLHRKGIARDIKYSNLKVALPFCVFRYRSQRKIYENSISTC
jgi:hypothetical protein